MYTKQALGIVLTCLLGACGGGGSEPTREPVDISQHAINAAQAVQATLPEAKAFSGGFVTIDNVPNGYLEGTSPRNLAEQIGAFVAENATKWPEQYRNMLSERGMIVSVAGARIGTSVSGAPIYASASVFSVRLTSGGVVGVREV